MFQSDKPSSAPIPPSPAPRETLQDFVYQQVKDLILNGEIEPGRTITIGSLATAFSVSHMPVREALHRLTAERALAVVAGRSVGIPPLTVNRVHDLRKVRIEVEGLAAEWAARNMDPATIEGLNSLYAMLDAAIAQGDVKTYLRANRELHFSVYEAAGSPTLISIIEPLWLQISPYFNLLHASGNYSEANGCHRALIDALSRGKPGDARRAIRDDIEASTRLLSTLLSD